MVMNYRKRMSRAIVVVLGIGLLRVAAGQTGSPPPAAPVATNYYYNALPVDSSTYDSPFRITLFNPQHGEDAARTWSQTQSIFGYGVVVVGVLAVLPESFTGWETEDNIFQKWVDNVKKGPRWDRDEWYINWIGHTYCGGVYYQVARKSGYRQWDSFIYSTLMSSFYWEYGVEAFAEVPSIQDLVMTPVLGWVYGEWAYQTEMGIRDNNNRVLGSKTLGSISLCLLDPIDALGTGVNRLVGRDWVKAGYGYFTYVPEKKDGQVDHQIMFHMRIPLGVSGPSQLDAAKELTHYRNDPVDSGIVGIAGGSSYQVLDSHWGMENDICYKASLGLYFTPRISMRLAYAWGDLEEKDTGLDRRFEHYSWDTQVYLNKDKRFRPYVTAGVGEQVWEEDRFQKTFQLNGGLGLHCRLHSKLALQADWINYYGVTEGSYDQSINLGLVYRFNRGEHSDW
jgi:hypothetical protein